MMILYRLFPRLKHSACVIYVCKVNDENNGVSPCCMVHGIQAKVEIVRLPSRIYKHPNVIRVTLNFRIPRRKATEVFI